MWCWSYYKPRTYTCFVGVKPGIFIEILFKNKYIKSQNYYVKGRAKIKNVIEQTHLAHIAKFS